MDSPKQGTQPAKYFMLVKNHLDSSWERWFVGMSITHLGDGVTILSGDVPDQSALYGLLEKVHNLNLGLIFVHKINMD